MMHVDKNKLKELKEKFGEPEAGFALGSLYIWYGFLSGGLGLILGIVGLATDFVPISPEAVLTGIVMGGIVFLLKRRKRIGLYANYTLLAVSLLDVLGNLWAETPKEWTAIARYIIWIIVPVLWLRYFYRRREMFTSSFFPL